MRMVRPCMPRASAWLSIVSIRRWMWFPCTEKCTSRMPNRSLAAANARSMTEKQRRLRRLQTCSRTRNVTWTAQPGRSCALRPCETRERVPFGLRPACFRRPTHVGSVNVSRLALVPTLYFLAEGSDIASARVHAQIEVFLRGLEKAEAISIACTRGLYVRRPDDPTVAMTSANAWNGGKTPPDLTCTSCTDARTRPLSPRWSMRTGDDAGPQTDRALQRREPSAERVSVLDLSRLDEVAGSSSYELTGYRRSRSSALEAQRGGTSRGPLCDRFGWKEIPGVRTQPGWSVAVRGAIRHALVAGVLATTAAVAGDRGNDGRSVPRGGCCQGGGPRGEGGAGDAGEELGRRRAQDQDRQARCPGAERGVLPDRLALGAHPERQVAGVEGDLRNARCADRLSNQVDQQPAWLVAGPGPADRQGQSGDLCRTHDEIRAPGLRDVPGGSACCADPEDPRERQAHRDLGERGALREADDGARNRSVERGPLRRCHRRDLAVRVGAQGRVVPWAGPGRELELRASAAVEHHQSRVGVSALGARTSGLGAPSPLSGSCGAAAAAVGSGNRPQARPPDRHHRPLAQAGGHPLCPLARWYAVRAAPVDRHRSSTERTSRRLSTGGDRDCPGEPESSVSRLRPTDGYSLCASSADARLRKCVDFAPAVHPGEPGWLPLPLRSQPHHARDKSKTLTRSALGSRRWGARSV